MGEGHTDLLPLVLKDEDIFHIGQGPQLLVAVGPDLYQVSDFLGAHIGQSALMLGGI